MSVASKRHMARVAALPCMVCEHIGQVSGPVELHHIGDSADRSGFLVIPTCAEHHRGATGFHGLGEREFNRRYRTSEIKGVIAFPVPNGRNQ